jgi:hypothetical protein
MNIIEKFECLKWWWISYKISRTQIKPFTLCRFKRDIPDDILKSYEQTYGKRFLFVNEIRNMKGHGYFIEQMKTQHIIGLHIESFEEIPEDNL